MAPVIEHVHRASQGRPKLSSVSCIISISSAQAGCQCSVVVWNGTNLRFSFLTEAFCYPTRALVAVEPLRPPIRDKRRHSNWFLTRPLHGLDFRVCASVKSQWLRLVEGTIPNFHSPEYVCSTYVDANNRLVTKILPVVNEFDSACTWKRTS